MIIFTTLGMANLRVSGSAAGLGTNEPSFPRSNPALNSILSDDENFDLNAVSDSDSDVEPNTGQVSPSLTREAPSTTDTQSSAQATHAQSEIAGVPEGRSTNSQPVGNRAKVAQDVHTFFQELPAFPGQKQCVFCT